MQRFAICALITVVALVSCKGAGGPMVGDWSLELSEAAMKNWPASEAKPNVSMTFSGDGTWTGTASVAGKNTQASGTYTLDGKALKVTTKMEDGKEQSPPRVDTATLSEDEKSFELPGMGALGKMVKK